MIIAPFFVLSLLRLNQVSVSGTKAIAPNARRLVIIKGGPLIDKDYWLLLKEGINWRDQTILTKSQLEIMAKELGYRVVYQDGYSIVLDEKSLAIYAANEASQLLKGLMAKMDPKSHVVQLSTLGSEQQTSVRSQFDKSPYVNYKQIATCPSFKIQVGLQADFVGKIGSKSWPMTLKPATTLAQDQEAANNADPTDPRLPRVKFSSDGEVKHGPRARLYGFSADLETARDQDAAVKVASVVLAKIIRDARGRYLTASQKLIEKLRQMYPGSFEKYGSDGPSRATEFSNEDQKQLFQHRFAGQDSGIPSDPPTREDFFANGRVEKYQCFVTLAVLIPDMAETLPGDYSYFAPTIRLTNPLGP